MRIEIVSSIADIRETEWNRLLRSRYPFLSHEFLRVAESSGSVSADSGWQPRHIAVFDKSGRLHAAMPLYEKSHSWGEFVFDWAWARAYEQAGMDYYPKLVSAAPFTPAPSRKLLLADDRDEDAAATLATTAIELAKSTGCSSLHVQFPTEEELPLLAASGLKTRKDCQFHWHNAGYRSFDDFLATFSSSKRKKAKRDRRHVAEQGISFRWLKGPEIGHDTWNDIYELISITFLRRGSLPYFSLDFFRDVSRLLPKNILAVLAMQNNEPIAAAIFYEGPQALYGRYWGSIAPVNALHFETCYYQGIDYCIANGKAIFEPGTQGEHKISRGFRPVTTWSAHWLQRPEFFEAVGHYLDDEKQHIERYMDSARSHSPYKQGSE